MMFFYSILLFVTLGGALILYTFDFRNYFRSKALIERNVVIIESFLISFIVYRLIEIMLSLSYEIGSALFIIMNGFLAIVIVSAVYVIFHFLHQTGTYFAKKNFLIFFISTICAVSFTINTLTFQYISVDGHLLFGMRLELFFTMTFLIFASFLLILYKTLKSMELYERAKKVRMRYYLLIVFVYVISACFLSAVNIFNFLLIASLIVLSSVSALLIFHYFEPSIFSKFWSHFAVQSLYIINNDGRTIFSHEFFQKKPEGDKSVEMFLIGGFIYAITHGIEQITKIKSSLRSIDLENVKLAFQFGQNSFGIIFTREINTTIFQKLKAFMADFERDYSPFLVDWDGNFEIFSKRIEIKDKDGKLRTLDINKILNRHFKT